jgi:hypothetical protein
LLEYTPIQENLHYQKDGNSIQPYWYLFPSFHISPDIFQMKIKKIRISFVTAGMNESSIFIKGGHHYAGHIQ